MPKSRGSRHLHAWASHAAHQQAGVISRGQLLSAGWSASEIRAQRTASRWSTMDPGIYRTATGEPTREVHLWAALLACGDGAALCLETAAEVWGFGPESDRVHVVVPGARRVAPAPGI